MKSFLKIAAIGITLTSLIALASQQQKPQDRQFERERTLLSAFHQLPAKNGPLTQERLHTRMPDPLQRYIGTFLPGYNKHPDYFPKEMIPALIEFTREPVHLSNSGTFITRTITVEPEYHSLLELLDLDEKRLKNFYAQTKPAKSEKPYIVGQTRFLIAKGIGFGPRIERSASIGIPEKQNRVCTKLESQKLRDEDNFEDKGFTMHIYSDGEMLFKLHWHKHIALLKSLSSPQIDYVISLYHLHKQAQKEKCAIGLDKHQIEIHMSLPPFVQHNLESNYNLAPINAIRIKDSCKRAFCAGLLAIPIAATLIASTFSS